jgi:hypothetical protein
MPRKYKRICGSGNLPSAWTEENLREAIKRTEANETGANAPSDIIAIFFAIFDVEDNG